MVGLLVASVSVAGLLVAQQAQVGESLPPQGEGRLVSVSELPVVVELEGETVRALEGREFGFESLSFAVTHTLPGAGAPPHRHRVEEAHIVLSGTLEYEIGGKQFRATAPFIARIPAGVQHSFRNAGTEPVSVVGVFPKSSVSEIDPE
jgi:mannose-6-phosphate isomerase-like protein (cupin superfamily)